MDIYINGRLGKVWRNSIANYCIYSVTDDSKKTADIEIRLDEPVGEVIIRPINKQIIPTITDNGLIFKTEIPCKCSVEFPNSTRLPIFLFLYDSEEEIPKDENVRIFPEGEYEIDELELKSNETLYLSQGAVLHTYINVNEAENITICGRGIIDFEGENNKRGRRMLHFGSCKNITVKDVTMTGANGWCCVIWGCENVIIDSVNIMTWVMCGDGIDIVGSHDVIVENSFIRTSDDCVAIKATNYRGDSGMQNVYNVSVRNCIMWNAQPGNGIEIGFETRCDEIYNVVFSDIDIIHCEHEGWQSGGAITIHNGDRAHIHDIVYKNIRVEDVIDKLFDFKVLQASYSKDEKRGNIEDILIDNVSVIGGLFAPSIISGFSGDDTTIVRRVTFKDISVHGNNIQSINDCRMIVERAKEINFEVTNDKTKK